MFHFYCSLHRNSCKQSKLYSLIKCHIPWHLILVCTVYIRPQQRFPVTGYLLPRNFLKPVRLQHNYCRAGKILNWIIFQPVTLSEILHPFKSSIHMVIKMLLDFSCKINLFNSTAKLFKTNHIFQSIVLTWTLLFLAEKQWGALAVDSFFNNIRTLQDENWWLNVCETICHYKWIYNIPWSGYLRNMLIWKYLCGVA